MEAGRICVTSAALQPRSLVARFVIGRVYITGRFLDLGSWREERLYQATAIKTQQYRRPNIWKVQFPNHSSWNMECTNDEYPQNLDIGLINPFLGESPQRMNQLIDEFMETTLIDDQWRELIRKGAFLAQDRDAFSVSRDDKLELTDDELNAVLLEHPKTGNKWNQPWFLYLLVACCSLGAAVQGWDEVSELGTAYVRIVDMLIIYNQSAVNGGTHYECGL